jgi:histidine phosphotransferase ChpT
MTDLKLTSAVCSKLLHDLAGPVGAVLNGSELLAEGGKGLSQADIVNLLLSSAEHLNAQIQAYRVAFGALSGAGEELSLEDVKAALDGYAKHKGYGAAWEGGGAVIHKDLAKLVFNTAFIFGEAVRKRGAVTITLGKGALAPFSLVARAERVSLNADSVAALLGQSPEQVTPAVVSGLYACAVAKALGMRLAVEEKAGEAKLTATL